MKKILIISLFLFGQQVFSKVIPEDQLTGAFQSQGDSDIYINNKVEQQLDTANDILCYLHSLRSESFVNQGNYQAWTNFSLCDKSDGDSELLKTIVDVSKTNAEQVVKAKTSVLLKNIEIAVIKLKATIRASATEANPLGDLTLNWTTDYGNNNTHDILKGILEVNDKQIQLIIYDNNQMTDSIISSVIDKKGSFKDESREGTFAFNNDFIRTGSTCFDRSKPIDTVWDYHIYVYTENANPNTAKLELDGIQPFAFKYKDDSNNTKYGYAAYDYTYLDGDHPSEIISVEGGNNGVIYIVEYDASNKINKLVTNGVEQSIAKPVEFNVSRIVATDIRSGEKPAGNFNFANSEYIYIADDSGKKLSLKDGAVLFDENNKKYIAKAYWTKVEYDEAINSDSCDDLLLPIYTEPTIVYTEPDVSGLSDAIDKISVIDGIIQ